jgi:nucleoside-diphosphate-sugar epimerase
VFSPVAGGGMRVVVTGATGYLGGRLCAALADAGHAVRALVRRSSDVSGLPPGVDLAYGDVTDAESLAAAFDGCDAVFHVAAAVEPWLPDPSVFLKVRLNPPVRLIFQFSVCIPQFFFPTDEGERQNWNEIC